ncbi:MAG: arsenate reductase (glutaredoxin) [Flavobacteriales bacterium]|nr:MAG: arsenate reductase (glutaredoxin) [Flavobacteriales bacterium]
MKIYHNPRCRKSRETLQILQEKGKEIEIIEYLKTPPTFQELKDILMKLNKKPAEIIRKSEKVFKKKFKGMNFNDDEWVKILEENPILIERPIVVRNNKAVIGRPPENVLELL